jgi:hypothetical protein
LNPRQVKSFMSGCFLRSLIDTKRNITAALSSGFYSLTDFVLY